MHAILLQYYVHYDILQCTLNYDCGYDGTRKILFRDYLHEWPDHRILKTSHLFLKLFFAPARLLHRDHRAQTPLMPEKPLNAINLIKKYPSHVHLFESNRLRSK